MARLWSQLPIQWNLVSPVASIPPFGTKVSRPADHKVEGTGGKHLAIGSLRRIVNSVTAISAT